MKLIKNTITALLAARGYKLSKIVEPDIEKEFITIEKRVKEYTMTSQERRYALFKAIEYVVDKKIAGDIVECGVWRGGSTMVCALALQQFHSTNKNIYLYDTYAGMSEPTAHDVNINGSSSQEKWKASAQGDINTWDYASLEEVQRNLHSTEYPKDKLFFIKGKIEETIPKTMPGSIALLRLDTDWYESTKHELEHLFPLLSPGGVLIIDDYGHWQGARKAVDEYFKTHNTKIFLHRIDYTGRLAIKI